jgi:macrolide transport system ATP-binding/permease protein
VRDALHHFRTTLRSLSRQPGLSLAVVLTLALGIGASTALFAYIAELFWPTLRAPGAERAVWIYGGSQQDPRLQLPYTDFEDLRRQQHAVVDLVAASDFGVSIGHGQEATYAWGQLVTGDFFSFFGTRPEIGRLLQPADDLPGAEPVLVVSHLFWQGTLGGDRAAVGRPLRVNGKIFTLVGVVPQGFQGMGRPTPIYMPMQQSDAVTGLPRMQLREPGWLNALGRLAPGTSLEQAQAALDVAGKSLDAVAPVQAGKRRLSAVRATAFDSTSDDDPFFETARVLMGAAILFLLLGCANVANLLLARATAKQRDWGIRASLGASRWRLARSVLADSLVLCAAGAALGLVFAAGMVHRIQTYLLTAPGGLGNWSEDTETIRLDPRSFLFALAAALLCGAFCGLAPAWRAIRGDLVAPIKSDAAGAVGGGRSVFISRKLLVVIQVALSALLLLDGSLLVRTLRQAETVDPGFNPRNLLLVTLYVPRNTVREVEGVIGIYRKILDETRALPGVEGATLAYNPPLSGFPRTTEVTSREQPGKPVESGYNLVAPGFFETLGLPILQGRALDLHDRRDAPAAVVISRSLARKLWGNENPIGRSLTISDIPRPGELGPVFQVVGVARDARINILTDPPGPMMYFSFEQRFHPRLTLAVRSPEPPGSLSAKLRGAVRSGHPDVAIVDLVSADEQVRRSLFPQRMHAEIAGLFGLLGLLVAVLGLFGLLSYTVGQRTREIGIRMAIGARRPDVLRLVLRQGMILVGIGLVLGIAGSFALSRVMSRILYGVAATDPLTFLSVPAVFLLVTLLACYLPARRASRLDPLKALRS